MKVKKEYVVSKNKIKSLKKKTLSDFPPYSTYLINKASETAQATRPKVVGQLTEEFPEFAEYCRRNSIEYTVDSWKKYHMEKHPGARDISKKKIMGMLENFRESLDAIDESLVEEWVDDLLYSKTFLGLDIENIIFNYFENLGHTVKKSTPAEESRGIDLYIDNKPYQIKPESIYREKNIMGRIPYPIIVYTQDKKDDSIVIKVIHNN